MSALEQFVEAAFHMHRGLGEKNLKDPEKITVTFKTLGTLYAFRRQMQDDWHWKERYLGDDVEQVQMPFARDGAGFVFFDITLLGIPFRFTTTERTCGFPPVLYVDGLGPVMEDDEKITPLITVIFDPNTHRITRI